jgi:hypothetical protein
VLSASVFGTCSKAGQRDSWVWATDIVEDVVVAVRASGGCLCGQVRFEVRGPLRDILICHCRECRRWSGHLFAAAAARRRDLVVKGQSLAWVESPKSDARARRGFCRSCGSSLFWDAPDSETVSIAAGALDEPTGLHIVGHVYTSHAGDYYELAPDGLPRYPHLTGAPTSVRIAP